MNISKINRVSEDENESSSTSGLQTDRSDDEKSKSSPSLKIQMISNNLQEDPLTAEEAKSHFKNHFDVINENIEKITVMQMQQKNEYHDLFEKSNW